MDENDNDPEDENQPEEEDENDDAIEILNTPPLELTLPEFLRLRQSTGSDKGYPKSPGKYDKDEQVPYSKIIEGVLTKFYKYV